jgi:histidinol-phosphatase (PHP family)
MDMHVHSTCSGDGASSIVKYARAAIDQGLAEVGFCEHADFDPRDSGYGSLDLVGYDRELASGQAAAPAIHLRKGVEVTYQSRREEEIRSWLAGTGWDYVVVSVHLVDYDDGWAIISDPETVRDYLATHSQSQTYLPYFEELLRAARSGLGDLLGHFDLVKRYGTAPYGLLEPAAFEGEIREVLRASVESGMGLEINSSGLRQQPGEPYPSPTVLRWYRELGGELLTVGSDAHHTDQLGAGIADVQALAREAGFRAVATFRERQPRWLDL